MNYLTSKKSNNRRKGAGSVNGPDFVKFRLVEDLKKARRWLDLVIEEAELFVKCPHNYLGQRIAVYQQLYYLVKPFDKVTQVDVYTDNRLAWVSSNIDDPSIYKIDFEPTGVRYLKIIPENININTHDSILKTLLSDCSYNYVIHPWPITRTK